MSRDVEAEIAALEILDTKALQARWALVYGRFPPKRIRRDLLRRAIAYRIQEEAFGGLRAVTVRRLKRLADKLATLDEEIGREAARPALRPGVRLMREWNGETHVVDVVADGFLWRGSKYASLSAIARAITGSRWSGPRFFGLLEKRS